MNGHMTMDRNETATFCKLTRASRGDGDLFWTQVRVGCVLLFLSICTVPKVVCIPWAPHNKLPLVT